MASKKRAKNNELDFKAKLQLIEEKDKTNKSEKRLADKFEISKSQVHRILKNRDTILKQKNNKSYLKRNRAHRKLITSLCIFR